MRDQYRTMSTPTSVRISGEIETHQIMMVTGVKGKALVTEVADPSSPFAAGRLFIAKSQAQNSKHQGFDWMAFPMDTKSKPGTPLYLGKNGTPTPYKSKQFARQIGIVLHGGVLVDLRFGAWTDGASFDDSEIKAQLAEHEGRLDAILESLADPDPLFVDEPTKPTTKKKTTKKK